MTSELRTLPSLGSNVTLKDADGVLVRHQGGLGWLPPENITQGETVDTQAGAGITDAAETYAGSVRRVGDTIITEIMIDLTGLRSTAGGDIIGDDGSSEYAYIAQVTKALNGTIFAGEVKCLEVPTGGDPDIDLYAADEGTGTEDSAIADLTETQLTNGGDHALMDSDALTAMPGNGQYLYLVAAATTDADYTAGKLLVTLYGTA